MSIKDKIILGLGTIWVAFFAYICVEADQSRRHAEAEIARAKAHIVETLPKIKDKWQELKSREGL